MEDELKEVKEQNRKLRGQISQMEMKFESLVLKNTIKIEKL